LFVTTVDDRVWEAKQVVNGREYYANGVSHRNATVFPTGIRETLKVTLKNGQELKVTPDHKILTNDGWKKAAELEKGHLVLVQSGPGRWAPADDIGEELGLLLGWISGDGWLTSDEKTVGLVFSSEETHLLDRFKDITEKFGGGIRNRTSGKMARGSFFSREKHWWTG
jgi:ribonucleoside-diphosphate reductase alpha chain